MTTLAVENVSKNYGTLETVSNVSLSIEAGERVALLGHNGAGKTTLLRMILGLTPVVSGTIKVLGSNPGSRHSRASIGFLPESVAFHGALTGREQLRHFARLKSVPVHVADDLLDRVGLSNAADRKIRTYSKGMRQRIGLAQALLGQPKLALLDEPTSGLDPISRHEFYDIVEELAQSGTAVLLSSHALTELETRTDRIAIMSQGKLVADNSLVRLRQNAGLPIRVNVTTTAENVDVVAERLGGERINGCSILLTCQQDEKISKLSQITAFGEIIKDVDVTPGTLEELYRHYSVTESEGK
ncbi:ABC transporter ATP-binding protein [Pseudohalocynthiibacter aestuariivivens]|jgi:Cu-processing system ATP-binding protein|uniref:ABC transporter ATP-binding protein n=1 Tax=Pseudohalocynthiibacter aestuariivivens TaxID=1591409 RepID=A0ABV5JC61_9RHOB|nr:MULTISPECIES: ABC transporter ATP-binding protein [Pseudohalocynthiibacter]MBS9716077.1 ABC transporter ATP-binding protein [Pseudohalocynthiibacter aestuariivivens]MCK0102366.1 ABC transporter ATP-binding protein [Pseudohalocynthiibacter sp. F2068]